MLNAANFLWLVFLYINTQTPVKRVEFSSSNQNFTFMSFNKNDRAQVVKIAQKNGMNWNTDRTKLTDGKNTFSFSSTGGSGTYNGGFVNTVHEVNKKSKR